MAACWALKASCLAFTDAACFFKFESFEALSLASYYITSYSAFFFAFSASAFAYFLRSLAFLSSSSAFYFSFFKASL